MWQRKGKVADSSSAAAAMKLDIKSTARSRRNRKGGKNNTDADKHQFFASLGKNMEAFIDASPLGVPDAEPWSPSTDKKKALLSNPISVLNSVSDTIDAVSPSRLFNKVKGGASGNMWGITLMLISIREGLANAEEPMCSGSSKKGGDDESVIVVEEADVMDTAIVVSSEGDAGDAYVDLGADRWGNSARSANVMKETVAEAKKLKKTLAHFLTKKALPFIDNLTLRANGIVVTPDDCSVECSLASLISMDEEDFDAMPSPGSIFTESDDSEFGEEEEHSVKTEVGIAEDDQLEEKEEDTEAEEVTPEEEKIEVTVEEDTTEEEEDVQEREAISEEKDDEEEYVNLSQDLTDSDDEDFVDVGAEIEK